MITVLSQILRPCSGSAAFVAIPVLPKFLTSFSDQKNVNKTPICEWLRKTNNPLSTDGIPHKV